MRNLTKNIDFFIYLLYNYYITMGGEYMIGNKHVVSVSMSKETHEKGKKKAKELGLSFSSYIKLLINQSK